MSLIANQTIFYINSKNRVSGTDSDFLYQIDITKENKYNKVCALQVSIPKSYYLIQNGEHFILEEGKVQVNIQVTPGNYTRKSFAATIQSFLNSLSPNGWIYAITYQNSSTQYDDGKYTFTVSGNSSQPSFIFDSDHNLYENMGFDIGSTNTFVADTLKSTNVINLQKESTLYLHSDMVNNGNDNVLQEVFASDSSDYSTIVFQQKDVEAYSKDTITNKNNVYRFYLTDENDFPINLNGLNLNVTIVLYEKNNIYEMIKQFLKLQILKK